MRPNGASLDPWSGGPYLVWDFTCPDTLAPSHLSISSAAAGSSAANAEISKRTKYSQLTATGDFIFTPVATETLDVWGPSALSLYDELGKRATHLTGDPRASAFLKQRLGLAVQRGNAASVAGTHPQGDINLY